MPGQPCIVCNRPDRTTIELALIRHDAGLTTLAKRFGNITHASLRRHLENHLGVTVAETKEFRDMLDAQNLLAKLGEWHQRMEDQYANADATGEIQAAVATARVGIQAIESFARITQDAEIERKLNEIEARLNTMHGGS